MPCLKLVQVHWMQLQQSFVACGLWTMCSRDEIALAVTGKAPIPLI